MADRPLMQDVMKRAFDANLRYWETVGRATTEYVQAVTKIWADAPITWTPGVSSRAAVNGTPAATTAAPALLLEGFAGAQARATIMVSNDLDREAEAQISVSSLRGPDGRFVAMEIRTIPETVKLAAGARVPVTLAADITDALAEGVDYHGEINVPGLSPRGVPLVLRRRA
jgi:hypothetical protein